MARPVVDEEISRGKFEIYISKGEYSDIKEKARSTGLSMSAFIRKAALGQKCSVSPSINAIQWSELSHVAGNINQIAKGLNEGQPFSAAEAMEIDTIRMLLEDIRMTITGGK